MDLYLLNELNKLESGGTGAAGGSVGAFLPDELNTDGTIASAAGKHTWAAVQRHNNRQSHDNWTWSSSDPYTTFYTYFGNNNSVEYCFHYAGSNVGGYSGRNNYSNWDTGSKSNLIYSTGRWVGRHGISHGQNSNSYSPFSVLVMFVKNPTNTDISSTFYGKYTNYWSSGHDGAGCKVIVPNNTDKSLVTGTSITSGWQQSGTSSSGTTNSATYSFPANKTVALVMAATDYYWTGTTNNYYWNSMVAFYNLQVLENAGLECDLEMTQTYYQGRWDGNTQDYSGSWRCWVECAKQFPPVTE